METISFTSTANIDGKCSYFIDNGSADRGMSGFRRKKVTRILQLITMAVKKLTTQL